MIAAIVYLIVVVAVIILWVALQRFLGGKT